MALVAAGRVDSTTERMECPVFLVTLELTTSIGLPEENQRCHTKALVVTILRTAGPPTDEDGYIYCTNFAEDNVPLNCLSTSNMCPK